MKRIREILISGLCVAVFVLLTSSAPARAQANAPNPLTNSPWTTVGAAGTVDPASGPVGYYNPLGTAEDAGAVALARGFFPETATIRYNVVSVPGILTQNGVALGARYLQQSADERVVVTLKQYNFATGTITNLLQIDSNNFANPSASFQFQYSTNPAAASPGVCNNRPPASVLALATLDFIHNAYCVEVTLTKPETIVSFGGGSPVSPTALGMVMIFDPSVITFPCNPGGPISDQ